MKKENSPDQPTTAKTKQHEKKNQHETRSSPCCGSNQLYTCNAKQEKSAKETQIKRRRNEAEKVEKCYKRCKRYSIETLLYIDPMN